MIAREALLTHSYERVADAVRRLLNFHFVNLKDQHDVHTREVHEKVDQKLRDWVRQGHVTVPETLRAYFAAVRTITRHTLIDFKRHFDSTHPRTLPLDEISEPTYTPPAPDDGEELKWWMSQILPPLEQEALELNFFVGLNLREISDTLGLSGPKAAQRLLQKAIVALREQFKQNKVASATKK